MAIISCPIKPTDSGSPSPSFSLEVVITRLVYKFRNIFNIEMGEGVIILEIRRTLCPWLYLLNLLKLLLRSEQNVTTSVSCMDRLNSKLKNSSLKDFLCVGNDIFC